MRDRSAMPAKKVPPRPAWLLLLAISLFSWTAACTPTAAEAPAAPAPSRPYTFYLGVWAEDFSEGRLIPLDPATLDDQPDGRTLEPGIFSDDGATRVDVEYPNGRASQDTDDIWIVIYDVPSGAERSRFHPPVAGFIAGLNADETRLLLRPNPNPLSPYPPSAEWYVLDTTDGASLAHIHDPDNACFRQRAIFDPAGQRIYCVVDPALTGANEPIPMQIVTYDVDSGVIVAERELPDVLIGGSETERGGQTVWEFLEPALVSSPDGQQLAIVHADTDKITLLDAQNLTVERAFALKRSSRLLDLFTPAVAHAKGEMTGTIRQAAFSLDGRYLYVFTQEVRLVPGQEPPERRGLQLIDLERETVVAEALPDYQVQWVQPAPDGTVYAFGAADERLGPYEIRPTSPSMLWRLDGATLATIAERTVTGYASGYLVEQPQAASTSETGIVEPERACPVTGPPQTAFVPPDPWPAQPPGMGQFWHGNADLWTALPTDGRWPQLALGEKFWWWSVAFDVAADATPDLTVAARRLDGDAAVFQTTEATNGYHESFNWAMLTGVTLESPGCWEFTGQYNGHELSFVLWVPPE